MNIGIIGYGVMGHLVAEATESRGHKTSTIVDPANEKANYKNLADVPQEVLDETDVFIEFSSPEVAMQNIETAAQKGVSLVMATTGWYEKLDEARKLVEDGGVGFVWSSNFSVGVNLFWQMIEKASALFGNQENYDVFTHEFHHKRKKDSPSGTGITTAEKILANHPRKNSIVTERLDRVIEPNELHVSSTRGGDVPGTHQVYFDSAFDTIQISHTARTREGFALGSVIAAEWLNGKKGFYDFSEIFPEICS